jgi:hypothetical protein
MGASTVVSAIGASHQLISYGGDGTPDQTYENGICISVGSGLSSMPPTPKRSRPDRWTLREAAIGSRSREFETINAINAIFPSHRPPSRSTTTGTGNAAEFRPVVSRAELAPIYIPELPLNDGWGRPILYASRPGAFVLALW